MAAEEEIFGPAAAALQGKTVRWKPLAVTTSHTNVPMEIIDVHKHITLSADIIFVNKYPFFNTIFKHIKFGTTDNVNNSKIPTLHNSLFYVLRIYAMRGFKVEFIKMDRQFEPMRAQRAKLKISLNTVSANEHVPEIERYKRTIN